MKIKVLQILILFYLLTPFVSTGQVENKGYKLNIFFPVTQLSPAFCGRKLSLANQVIYADSVPGAEDYEYRFNNDSLGLSTGIRRGQGSNDLSLNWLSGLLYGTTYNVQVRVKVYGEWKNFGKICKLTTVAYADVRDVTAAPTVTTVLNTQGITIFNSKTNSTDIAELPQTQLSSASCGLILDSLEVIHCDPIEGAQNYEYRFVNGLMGFDKIISRDQGTTDLDLAWVHGLQPDVTYYVDVRAYINGSWSAYGDVCTIRVIDANNKIVLENLKSHIPTINMDAPVLIGETTAMSTYPNPVTINDVLTVDMENVPVINSPVIYMSIYDFAGNVVMSQEFAQAKRIDFTIDSRFKQGFYFVEMYMDDKRYCKRIVVK